MRKIPQYVTETEVSITGDYPTNYTKTETTKTRAERPVEMPEWVEYASIGTVEGGTKPPLVYRPASASGGVSPSSTSSKTSKSSNKKE
ncbi:MAG: hypothetical protein J6W64_06900, partial [Bacilli bacterium]|nr:hypothetical protein [Bacilli bacterium]